MDNGNLEVSSDQLFFRIGQVCRLTDIKPFTLRYWESEFPILAPVKSSKGHRLYRREDVQTVLRIKRLLYDEGFTIAGARRCLRDADAGPAQQPLAPSEAGNEAAHDAASQPSRSPRRDERSGEFSPIRMDAAAAPDFSAARSESHAEVRAAQSTETSAPQPADAANMLSRKLLLDLRDSLRAFLTLLESE